MLGHVNCFWNLSYLSSWPPSIDEFFSSENLTPLANRMALIKFLRYAPVLGFGENCVRLCFSDIFRLCFGR